MPLKRIVSGVDVGRLSMRRLHAMYEGGLLRVPGRDFMEWLAGGEVVEEGEVRNIRIVVFGNVFSLEFYFQEGNPVQLVGEDTDTLLTGEEVEQEGEVRNILVVTFSYEF